MKNKQGEDPPFAQDAEGEQIDTWMRRKMVNVRQENPTDE